MYYMSLLRMEHDSVMYKKNLWAVCLTATWPVVYVRQDLFMYDMTHKKNFWAVCLTATWPYVRLDLLFVRHDS